MESVPKIVVKRLQSKSADSHPDADLLTAFAEHSLAGGERDHVVEHLARCSDCREIISLAIPPQAETQPLAPSTEGWFRWSLFQGSALRWTTVAAGLALIASFGILQYHRQNPRELASNSIPGKQASATPSQTPPPQTAVPQARMQSDKKAAARAQSALAEKKIATSDGANFRSPATVQGGAVGGTVGGAIVRPAPGRAVNSFHGSAFAAASPSRSSAAAGKESGAPAPPQQVVEASGASQTVEVQSEAAPVTLPETAQNQLDVQRIQNEPAEQAQASADRVGKAKPASPQTSVVMAPAPLLHTDPMKGPAAPRWTISATGALQRSFDGGQTWVDVHVVVDDSVLDRRAKAQVMTVEVQAESTSESQSAPQAAMSANTSANAKSMKKQSAASTTVFRALSVSSNASEVWAGGSGGALYHTVDSGNRWTTVVPFAAGVALTGDILSIQFSDPQNGVVTTSTAELWTTPDDGQSWHKQK